MKVGDRVRINVPFLSIHNCIGTIQGIRDYGQMAWTVLVIERNGLSRSYNFSTDELIPAQLKLINMTEVKDV